MNAGEWVIAVACGVGLVGCGGDPASPPPGADPVAAGPSAEDVATLRASLGEATCGTTPPDATIQNGVNIARSPNAQYGHPTCTNGFVVGETGVYKGQALFAQSSPTARFDLFECPFSWSYVGVWQKQGGNYVKVGETLKLGTLNVNFFAPQNNNCDAAATVVAPADGDYKIVAAAGNFFTGYSVVDAG